jgi:single-strand DNA-binding protein
MSVLYDTITITGNIAADPELKRTPTGVAIASFRVGSSQRRFDRNTGTWEDTGTNWYAVSAYRGLADHVFASLRKGDRVILTGRLKLRQWETDSKRGVAIEIDADAVGHDLRWGTSTFVKAERTRDGGQEPSSPEWAVEREDSWAAPGVETAAGESGAAGAPPAGAPSAPPLRPELLDAAAVDAPF